MAGYRITFARSARKELEALPVDVAERVLEKIAALATNARPAGCRKLRGAADLWRLRIGEYRIVYRVDDKSRVVDVVVIRHRRDVYR